MTLATSERNFRLFRVLAIVFSLFVLAIDIATAYISPVPPPTTDIGGLALRPLDVLEKPVAMVVRVRPGSQADAAGIKPGDRIQFERYADLLNRVAGHTVDMTVISGGVARKAAIAWSVKPDATYAPYRGAIGTIDVFSSLLSVLLGTTVLLRSRARRWNIGIGMLLVCLGYSGYALTLSPTAPDGLVIFLVALDRARIAASDIFFLYFARWLFEEEVGPLPRAARLAVNAFAAILFTLGIANVISVITSYAAAIFASHGALDSILLAGSCLFSSALLWMGWSRSTQEVRLRYAVIMGSVTVLIAAFVSFALYQFSWIFYAVGEILNVIFICLFAYAVLRHRVIDLGFAVNRAVVYGVISAVTLVTFGLAEWMAEHVVHFEDRKESVLLDGGIALATYLVFHRIKHSVEHWIEKLFFRSWHDNEARLRRFVHEAAFISNVDALWGQFERALDQFTRARCQVLLPSAAGGFAARRSGMQFGENTKIPLALQADRKRLVVHEEPLVPTGSLAAPVFLRGSLQAIVLVEARENGVPFRPDEIEAVATAVNEIGHDYLALRLNVMEKREVEQEQKLKIREIECGLLRSQMGQ